MKNPFNLFNTPEVKIEKVENSITLNEDFVSGTSNTNGNTEPASETSSPSIKYNLNDNLVADGKDVSVVAVLGNDVYHVKNKDIPFDSFIINLATKEVFL